PCASGGVCLGQAGQTPGTCCFNTALCDGTSCTVIDTCTGATINCCGPNQYCDPITNTCKDKLTCADYTDGEDGSTCSNSAYFADGAGGFLTCPCDPGGVCIETGGTPPGTCCFNTAQCNGTSCTVINTCTGATINCCKTTEYCDSGPNICVAKKVCSDYLATGQIGAPCSNVPSLAFPVGDGTGLKCDCSTSANKQNNTCVGSDGTTAGACQCTATVCDCSISGTSDGCGAILSCACTGGQVCDKTTKTCCTPYQCSGATGSECGIARSSCGTTVTCQCTEPYDTCGGGGVANICGCTKDSCQGLSGIQPDGCGGYMNCGS
ncbi:MAG: hypothetical protein V1754_03885, partial [Pseudomonadota bacterium]